jgi:molybdopterin/thiamine biosynthesis adenylyltransferase
MSLSPEDLTRHKRHLLLKEIGGPGVAKLRAASVSIIGCGALGGPAALYLAAAGVGTLELWDDDVIERSNLQRQIQFDETMLGKRKAATLAHALSLGHPATRSLARTRRWAPGLALEGQIILDACDNYETRFALNQLALETRRPLVHGAAALWQGELAVFAPHMAPGSACYRCFVPEVPPQLLDCNLQGVAGPVTGLIGAGLALEAIKLITGAGEALTGRLLRFDGLGLVARTVRLPCDPSCPDCAARSSD